MDFKKQKAGCGHLELLLKAIGSRIDRPGNHPTQIDGMSLFYRTETDRQENCLYRPMIVLVVQGAKRTRIGTEIHDYRAGEIMAMGVDLPAASVITSASPERPYISIGIDLDIDTIVELSQKTQLQNFDLTRTSNGLFTQRAGSELKDAFVRLIKLLDRPERIPVMAPMLLREIHFLLLMGPNGDTLRAFHTMGYKSNQITRAISLLRQNLAKPVQIEEIADEVNMASSTFHRHFKKITHMSPLQYLKKLRLHEAQRLMLSEGMNSGKASSAVGYVSLSQFNREYKRMFGDPPGRSVTKIKHSM